MMIKRRAQTANHPSISWFAPDKLSSQRETRTAILMFLSRLLRLRLVARFGLTPAGQYRAHATCLLVSHPRKSWRWRMRTCLGWQEKFLTSRTKVFTTQGWWRWKLRLLPEEGVRPKLYARPSLSSPAKYRPSSQSWTSKLSWTI